MHSAVVASPTSDSIRENPLLPVSKDQMSPPEESVRYTMPALVAVAFP